MTSTITREEIAARFNITPDSQTEGVATISDNEIAQDAGESLPLAKNPLLKIGVVLAGISFAGAFLYTILAGKGDSSLPLPTASAPPLTQKDSEIAQLRKDLDAARSDTATAQQKIREQQASKSETGTFTKPPLVAGVTPVKKDPVTKSSIPAKVAKASKPKTPDAPPIQPVVSRQPMPVVKPPVPRPIPSTQSIEIANLKTAVKAQDAKLDKLLNALATKDKDQQKAPVAKKVEPVKVAAIPPSVAPQSVATQPRVSPLVGSRVEAYLVDPINVSASTSNSKSASQTIMVKLIQPVKTSDGLVIPATSMVAIETQLDPKNGFVTGQSTGVWTADGQQLDFPAGAFALQGDRGSALSAKAVDMGSGDVAAAQNSEAMWSAVGGGVEQITRSDTDTTIINSGIAIATNKGVNKDFLVGAVGGLAKAKASSEQANAKERVAKAAGMAPIWHLPVGTRVTLAAVPMTIQPPVYPYGRPSVAPGTY
jgi:hypothetical protein